MKRVSQRSLRKNDSIYLRGFCWQSLDRDINKNIVLLFVIIQVSQINFLCLSHFLSRLLSQASRNLPSLILSCSNFLYVMSQTSNWADQMVSLYSCSKITFTVFIGQQQRKTRSAYQAKIGRINFVVFNLWAFSLFFRIVSCHPPCLTFSSGVFWMLWLWLFTALAHGNMTNWHKRTKMSWLFQLNFLGVSFTVQERQKE